MYMHIIYIVNVYIINIYTCIDIRLPTFVGNITGTSVGTFANFMRGYGIGEKSQS